MTRPERDTSPLDSHRQDAAVENARFMLAHGEPMVRVAARLGMTVGGVEKMLDRNREETR